jgi:hypothetical protein
VEVDGEFVLRGVPRCVVGVTGAWYRGGDD